MKKITLILLCSCLQATAQRPRGPFDLPDPAVPPSRYNSGYYNMEKYWWYRYRLVNDFMKIGMDCGESLPAQRRNKPTDFHPVEGYLKWADATIDLGNYIAMLGTEHRILKNAGLGTERSAMELKYALDAFDRLDRNAEAYCANIDGTYSCNTAAAPAQWQNKLNGFFIRDDVPYMEFVQNNWDHFNRQGIKDLIPVDKWSGGAFLGRYDEPGFGLKNEFSTYPDTWPLRPSLFPWIPPAPYASRVPSEESQDQVVQLAMGLSLAGQNSIAYKGRSLDMQAQTALSRMIGYVGLSGGFSWENWSIINPVTGKCVYGINPTFGCNAGGGQMYPFGEGAAQTADLRGVGLPPVMTDKLAWHSQQFLHNIRDCNFGGTWAALTRGWYAGIKVGTPFGAAKMYKNTTWSRMVKFGMWHDEGNPHLPYLYRVMFPGKGEWFRVEQTKQLLDAAPDCGIHNYKGTWSVQRNWKTGMIEHNPPKSHHWSGNDLIHEYYNRWRTGDNSDCNGLDFMVLFNLYAIQLGDYFPEGVFNSYYKENFKERFPRPDRSGALLGNKDRRLQLNFLEYLSASNKLDVDADLTFRGAKVIDLLPGFEAKKGANFKAYIQDYEIRCGHPANELGPAVADDAYHYAQVSEKKRNGGIQPTILRSIFLDMQQDGGNGPQLPDAGEDTTYYLDYPPDGSTYMPDEAATVDGTEETEMPTCAEERAIFDSLVAQIYASGAQDQIDYLDSVVIPNIAFPACDSTQDQNYRIAANNNDATNFNVYPNPNNGNFTIAFDTKGDYSIVVYNSLGAVIYSGQVYERKTEALQLSGLPPGIYTLVVSRNGTPQVQRKKISIVY